MTIPNFVINVGVDSGGDVLVKDDITNPNLRYSDDGYATAVFTGVNSGSGRYTFTNVTSGVYRLYDGTSAVAGLGDIYVGESSVVTLTTTQTITGIKTFSGAVTLEKPTLGGGGVDITIDENTSVLTGNKFEVADAPTTSTGVARKIETDALNTALTTYYFDKRDGAANQNVYPNVSFRNNVTIFSDPAGLLNAANRKFVENYCSAILSGLNPSAYQQSTNIIRVLYSGTQETNKVYTTLSSAIIQAESFASSSRIMIVDIQGDGAGGEAANYNLLPTSVDEYVNIVQKPNSTIVAGEVTYTASTLGLNILQGGIIDNENASAGTTFENWIFKDVRFTNLDGTGTYTFNNCIFQGDCSYDNCSVSIDSNSIGEIYDNDNEYKRHLRAPYRQLGRVSIVASASSLTLTEGNVFKITGTNTVNLINTTGWTPGSRVILYANGGFTLTNGASASGSNYPILSKSGTDIVLQAGDYTELFLNTSGDYWYELDSKISP